MNSKSSEQETCWKCNGSGEYKRFGVCFSCKGTGKLTKSNFTLANHPVETKTYDCEAGQHQWFNRPDFSYCGLCGERN